MDWSLYPNFKESEFKCHETQECQMHPMLMAALQDIRNIYKKPMIISSGFRSVHHSAEKEKLLPGEHTYGMAADIKIHGRDALDLLEIVLAEGIHRIGVNQKGGIHQRFIHIGISDKCGLAFKPAIWTY